MRPAGSGEAELPALPAILRIIREEASALEFHRLREELQSPLDNSLTRAVPGEEWPEDDVEALRSIPAQRAYAVGSFLVLDDLGFIENAYRIVLRREADPEGAASYMAALRSGALRQDILCSLAESGEGRRWEVEIDGLGIFRFSRRYLDRHWIGRRLSFVLKNAVARWQALTTLSEQATRTVQPILWLMKYHKAQRAFRHNLHLQHDGMRRVIGQLGEALTSVSRRADRMERELAALKAERLASLHYEAPPRNRHAAEDRALSQAPGSAPAISEEEVDRFYFHFEEACRGPQDEILRRLTHYLPHLPHGRSRRVLDLGCGRGEWLSILKDAGFDALGLDISPSMLGLCRQKGLNVLEVNIIDYLRAQPENSHAAVSAFHLAEHVPFDLLLAIVRESHRVLENAGVLIMETPNPENILVGSHTFYHDPTHRNPLTPTFMEFLAHYCCFTQVEILRLNPYPEAARVQGHDPLTERVNGHLCGPQDFALVARKEG